MLLWLAIWLSFIDPPWQFAVIGDTQTNWHVARKAVAEIKKAQPEFTVHLGDIWGCASPKRWRATLKIFEGTNPRWVIGNHELRVCGRRTHRPKQYRALWRRIFNREDTYGSWTWYGFRFIAIDSATPDIYTSQLKWIKTEIEGSSEPLFLFSHRPFPSKRYGRWYRLFDPMPWRWRNAKFGTLIEKHDARILAKFHGHRHGFKFYGGDTWNTGGGGGVLAKEHRYHWLLVTVYGPFVFVERKLI